MEIENLKSHILATFLLDSVSKLRYRNKNVDLLIEGVIETINNLNNLTQSEKRAYIDAIKEFKEKEVN
jgi:hypothetical protein